MNRIFGACCAALFLSISVQVHGAVIVATAAGSPNPPTAIHPAVVVNGDFTIANNAPGPVVGDGVNELTTWNFDFTGHPNFPSFRTDVPLAGALLTVTLTPKDRLITTDSIAIVGLSGIGDQIKSLPVGVLSTIELQLLNYYSSEDILAALQDNEFGKIPMIYGDDSILSFASLELTPAAVDVPVDVKPGSCPNAVNLRDRGVLPTAILGSAVVDATEIDPESIRLAGVAPLRWDLQDVATPWEPFLPKSGCLDCNQEGPDGLVDLTLKFDMLEIARVLSGAGENDCVVISLTGNLKEEFGGAAIVGEDVIVLRGGVRLIRVAGQ